VKVFRLMIASGVALAFAAGCEDSTPAGEAARGETGTTDLRGISGSPDAGTPGTQGAQGTRIIGDVDTTQAGAGQQPQQPRQ
jgi:hypothetical protein